MTKKEAIIRGLKSFDYLLALAVIGVSVFSIAMIYASSNHPGMPTREFIAFSGLWRLTRMHVITGTFMMILFACVSYRLVTRAYLIVYGLMMALLLAVMLVGADDATSTARWLQIPIPGLGNINLQPSEFAKIFMIIFLARVLELKKDSFNKVHWLGLILATIAVPVGLVVRQPSLSAAFVILFVSFTVLFTAGLKLRYIIIGAIFAAIVLILLWLELQRVEPLFLERILEDYQIRRIRIFLDPSLDADLARQVEGSRRAIASGGLTGKGLFNNDSYLIFAHNDLIFAVVAEQFGFAGSAALLGVKLLIVVKCIIIAVKAIDLQGRLIAAGVAGMIIFETFVHVGVVTGFMPPTGMPFPFLSYGGSMMWVHMIAIGMVLNVGLKRDKEELEEDMY